MGDVIANLEQDANINQESSRGEGQTSEARHDETCTKGRKRNTEHGAAEPSKKILPQTLQTREQALPAKWLELKKEYDMRTGCGLQVDWATICRETNASDACYGYLAGQLTSNIQATAQDKAAQLRQAVRDGWKQYRSKGQAAQARSEKPSEVIAESAEASDYKWVHAGCTAKPASQRFGLGSKPDQKQVYCKACSTKFWTIGKEPEQIAKQTASPWVCTGCSQELSKKDFSLKQRTKGAHKKCKFCTK